MQLRKKEESVKFFGNVKHKFSFTFVCVRGGRAIVPRSFTYVSSKFFNVFSSHSVVVAVSMVTSRH